MENITMPDGVTSGNEAQSVCWVLRELMKNDTEHGWSWEIEQFYIYLTCQNSLVLRMKWVLVFLFL